MPRVADSHNTFDERVAALLKDFLDGLQGAVGAIATDPAVSHLIADRLRTVETQVVMGIQGVRMQLGGAAAALPVAVASPGSLAPPPAISPQVASAAAAAEVTGPWKVWKHPDGGFKNVPPGFILPGRGNSVGQCFRLWMLGDPANGIRPFRALSTKDFGTFEASSTGRKLNRTAMTRRYCEWKKLFEYLLDAVPEGLKSFQVDPTEHQVEQMWESVKHLLYANVTSADGTTDGTKHKKKVEAQSVYTAYEYAFKKRKHGGEGGANPPGSHLIRRRKRNKTEVEGLPEPAAPPTAPEVVPMSVATVGSVGQPMNSVTVVGGGVGGVAGGVGAGVGTVVQPPTPAPAPTPAPIAGPANPAKRKVASPTAPPAVTKL